MTDRITALRALEAAMVALGRASYIRDLAVEAGMSWGDASTLANACDGDPTSAFNAKAALVPEWELVLTETLDDWTAELHHDTAPTQTGCAAYKPARAIALAIVRALIVVAQRMAYKDTAND